MAVKRVCDDAIRANYEQLPMMFADKHQFDNFRRSAEQRLLSADNFTTYQKTQDSRLKSIEEKLTHRYALLTINRHDKNGSSESKSYFNLDTIIQTIKNSNLQWLKAIIVCSLIGMLAIYLLSSINN